MGKSGFVNLHLFCFLDLLLFCFYFAFFFLPGKKPKNNKIRAQKKQIENKLNAKKCKWTSPLSFFSLFSPFILLLCFFWFCWCALWFFLLAVAFVTLFSSFKKGRISYGLVDINPTFHFWRKSCRIASFLVLSTSKIEEVSQNCFVSGVVNLKHRGNLGELLRFRCCEVQKLRKNSSVFKLADR